MTAATDVIEDQDDEAEDSGASRPDQSKLTDFLIAFHSQAQPQVEQRAQCLLARRFATIPGAQWEGDWDDFSANMIRVEVNKTWRGLEKICNDYRANRVEVDFRAVDDQDEQTADTLDDLFRADVYRSGGQEAFDNCFFEGAGGGLGAIELYNDYEDELDPDSDEQCIRFGLVPDADQSCFWGYSTRYDKRDAPWACKITAYARAAFIDEFGADKIADWPTDQVKPFYDWFTPSVVKVATWWQVEQRKERRWTLTNAVTGEEQRVWANDVSKEWLDEQLAGGWSQKGRDVPRRRVHKYILSGMEILRDEGLIAGPNIPLVPFYGKRWFVDNMERFSGHVQLAMDPQRIYNSQVSRLVEISSTSPTAKPIVTPSQMAGHSDVWARANIDRLPFVYLNPTVDADGNEQPLNEPPMLLPPDVPNVTAALLQLTGNDIADLTNSDDGADEVKANVSHEAMDLAATRTDEKSSGYMDNFRLTMQRVGEVYLGMAKEIYVEEGRKVPQMARDSTQSQATLMMAMSYKGRYLTINDFSQGRFNVIADVTESSATKRDKTVRKALGVAQIAGSNGSTDLANAALLTAVVNMDGDGMDDFKEYARKAGIQIGLVEPNDAEKQEMEQAAAQKQGQVDPAEQALMAQSAKLLAEADKLKAQGMAEQADAILKIAQAHAVGGPEQAPSGLQAPPPTPAEQIDQVASARLKIAQANHLAEQTTDKRIRRGHEILMDHAGHALDVRAQDHEESQPPAKAA